MMLCELWDKTYQGYWNGEDDNSKTTLQGMRKSRLTLRQLHKLRLMNDIRNVERKAKLERLKRQYVYIPPK